MAWETRGGRGRYFTRSKREGGRVVREYIGSGPAAECRAGWDALERAERQAARLRLQADREKHAALAGHFSDFWATVENVVSTTLTTAGYHQHARGEWRKKRISQTVIDSTNTENVKETPMTEQTSPMLGDRAQVQELMRRAQEGDLSVQKDMRQTIAMLSPEGLLPAAVQVRTELLTHLCGKDGLLMADLQQQMHALMESLLGQTLTGGPPTALERLLAERVVTCWLFLHVAEMHEAQSKAERTVRQAELSQKRVDSAQRRYLSAIKALAQVRRLQLPTVQVNIADKQINLGEKQLNVGGQS